MITTGGAPLMHTPALPSETPRQTFPWKCE